MILNIIRHSSVVIVIIRTELCQMIIKSTDLVNLGGKR